MRETDPSSPTQLEPGEAPAQGSSVVREGLRLCMLPQDLFVLGSSGDIQAAKGVRCSGCVFFLNARREDMAGEAALGRQKCFFCSEAYLISDFRAFILFPSVHL